MSFHKDVPLVQTSGDTYYPRTTEDSVWGADGERLDNKLNAYKNSIQTMERLQTAGGASTAITLTGVKLEKGFTITFIVKTNNNSSPTTINGKYLYKHGTTTSPKLVAGKAVTVWYNGTYFFIKASAEGDALAEHVLAGKTFSTDDDAGLVGTMANHGSRVFTPSDTEQSGNAGYYDGIIINPRPSLSGDAAMADVLAGKTFYGNDYTKKTGNMPDRGTINHALPINGSYTIPAGKHSGSGKVTQAIPTKGAQTITPGTANKTIAAGRYLSGAQTILGDPDLVSANILAGKNIFGVVGSVVAGKRFASGIQTPAVHFGYYKYTRKAEETGYTATFNQANGVKVTGLNFTPSVVIIIRNDPVATRNTLVAVYQAAITPNNVMARSHTGDDAIYWLSTDNGDVSAQNGFELPAVGVNVATTWYAWE